MAQTTRKEVTTNHNFDEGKVPTRASLYSIHDDMNMIDLDISEHSLDGSRE